MSVTHASVDYGIPIHGTPQIEQWDAPLVVHRWFNVVGEATFAGRNHGRRIKLPCHLSGYASLTAILTGINNIQNVRGLAGELTIDLGGGDAPTFSNCVFESLELSEEPWLDASGVNGWQCDATLTWRQSAA